MVRQVSEKLLSQTTAEWDALAPVRFRQISSGDDISYNRVIAPAVLSLVGPLRPSKILDAGCGTGLFTIQLAEIAGEIVGVDPSAKSIEIARGLGTRTKFLQETIEEFSLSSGLSFDVVVANMVLMDALCLESFLVACKRLMAPQGALIFSITHPCFWPQHYGYASSSWFRYEDELLIEAPFRITADQNVPLVSTHVHRPLSSYITSFVSAGFSLKELKEPVPPPDVDAAYRRLWKFPRYIVGRCVGY